MRLLRGKHYLLHATFSNKQAQDQSPVPNSFFRQSVSHYSFYIKFIPLHTNTNTYPPIHHQRNRYTEVERCNAMYVQIVKLQSRRVDQKFSARVESQVFFQGRGRKRRMGEDRRWEKDQASGIMYYCLSTTTYRQITFRFSSVMYVMTSLITYQFVLYTDSIYKSSTTSSTYDDDLHS